MRDEGVIKFEIKEFQKTPALTLKEVQLINDVRDELFKLEQKYTLAIIKGGQAHVLAHPGGMSLMTYGETQLTLLLVWNRIRNRERSIYPKIPTNL